jgi:hypothetical protein
MWNGSSAEHLVPAGHDGLVKRDALGEIGNVFAWELVEVAQAQAALVLPAPISLSHLILKRITARDWCRDREPRGASQVFPACSRSTQSCLMNFRKR